MKNILTNFLRNTEINRDDVLFTIALRDGHHALTYSSLLEGGTRFANLLKSRGATPGDVVLISLMLEADLIHAFLGALLAGCIPSMMPFPSAKQDPGLFWANHAKLFKHISGGYFITFGDNVDAAAANIEPGLLTLLTPMEATDATPMESIYSWAKDDVCALQHSSGTTGLKKGVTLTSGSVLAQIESYARALELAPYDTIISWLPLYHDMGFVATFLMPLVLGNPSVIMSPFEWLLEPFELFALVDRYNGAFVWLPNFAFAHLSRSLRDTDRANLSQVKAFINCSEPCKPETFDAFLDAFARFGVRREQLRVCYAMAETVFAVTQTPPATAARILNVSQEALRAEGRIVTQGDDLIALLSNGPPLAGIELRITGENAVGEIGIKGDFVFDGYYKIESRNAFSKDGYYLTGDLGFIHEGDLYILGRTKDRIIILGKNFFANEIEAIINNVPGVKPGRSVALGIYNEEVGSEDPIIIAELDGSVDKKLVRRGILESLESTIGLTPKRIVLVEKNWIVKSTSGKISRSENAIKYTREFVNE